MDQVYAGLNSNASCRQLGRPRVCRLRIAVPNQPRVFELSGNHAIAGKLREQCNRARLGYCGMSTIRNAQLAMIAFPKLLKYGAVPNPCNYRQPTDCIREERLLLMAGSQGKVHIRPEQRVAPIDLYTA
jgi:hypothetical protein